jgi:hypothetical protein
VKPILRPILAILAAAFYALAALAIAAAIFRNLAGENVDCGNPAHLRPVSAWPWENQ